MQQYPLLQALKQYETLSQDQALDAFLAYVSTKNVTLYEAQEEAILGVFAGNNVILNTPTGSGKSLVAIAMHFKSLSQGRRSIYTCPIKALVNEKFLALCHDFGPDQVGMITGDGRVNDKAPIICCTAEILANWALRDGDKTPFDDIVMDEFHYYADRDRGVSWQIPLLTLPYCRFLLMSATLGDTAPFKNYLEELTEMQTLVVKSTNRPVPLEFKYKETSIDKTVEDLLNEDKAPVYVVNFTQRDAAEISQSFTSLNFCSKSEKQAIENELLKARFTSPYGKEIKKLLKHGIGLHHGGLLPKYRILVENLAQKGLLKLIVGTDTLGVGVNVPIRTVLFTKLCKYDGEKTTLLSVRDFHQISGRAGRKGFDEKGYVVCQAPEHVIANFKLEQKAKLNTNTKKKFVRAKPPEKGYVHWDEEIFKKLQDKEPETLVSKFKMTHAMLLNILSRKENGCVAAKQLIRSCHEKDSNKKKIRALAMQMFRSLVERKIIQFISKEEIEEENLQTKIRVNLDLQEDFNLTQTLSLYLLDTLGLLDPMHEEYCFHVLNLVESIIEDPDLILLRQLDKVKREKLAELKEQGVEFEERMRILEELEYPKPNKDFIYNTFNEFAAKHPWMGQNNISPKGVAKEMFENYLSFADYVKEYGLERVEGLLLRYLSSVYKVLVQTVPFDLKNDDMDDMIAYFETIIKTTDSSIVDEWEKLKDSTWTPSLLEASYIGDEETDITTNKRAFAVLIRNAIFQCLRALAKKDYLHFCELINEDKEHTLWNGQQIEDKMREFYLGKNLILTTQAARNPSNLRFNKEDPLKWQIELSLIDDAQDNDWQMIFSLDIEKSKHLQKPFLELLDITSIS